MAAVLEASFTPSSKVSSSTLVAIGPAGYTAVGGEKLILFVSSDNLSSTTTPTITSVTRGDGGDLDPIWVQIASVSSPQSAAAAGVRTFLWYADVPAGGGTISATINFSAAITAKAAVLLVMSGLSAGAPAVTPSQTSATTTNSLNVPNTRIWVHGVASESAAALTLVPTSANPTIAAFTTGGSGVTNASATVNWAIGAGGSVSFTGSGATDGGHTVSQWTIAPEGPPSVTRTATAGVTLGGSATPSIRDIETATGGVTLGGSVAHSVSGGAPSETRTATAGVTLSGTAASVEREIATATAGVTLGGTATQITQLTRTATGGVSVGGTAAQVEREIATATAGITLGGSVASEVVGGGGENPTGWWSAWPNKWNSEAPDAGDYATLVLESDPLIYWRLGETSGITAVDSSGNGYPGTYEGGYTLDQPSLLGYESNPSVALDGTNGAVSRYYVQYPDVGFTYEAIIHPTEINSFRAIMGGDGTHQGPYMYLIDGKVTLWHGGQGGQLLQGATTLPANETHHVAITVGAIGEPMRIYIDGALDATATRGFVNDSSGLNREFIVGASGAGSTGARYFAFDGRIDEVAYYGTALTGTVILSHAVEAGLAGPPPSGETRTALGTFTIGGNAQSFVRITRTAEGGPVLDGTAPRSITATRTAAAGVTLGGSLVSAILATRTATAGVALGGSAPQVTQAPRNATGGVTLGGSVIHTTGSSRTATATVTLSGSVVHVVQYARTATAGVTIGGTADPVVRLTLTATGGISLGGTAAQVEREIATAMGGPTLGGNGTSAIQAIRTADGGVTIGGLGFPSGGSHIRTASAGVTLGGTAQADTAGGAITRTATGGVSLSGTATHVEREVATATGGVSLGGSAPIAGGTVTRTASAGIAIGGTAVGFVRLTTTAGAGVTIDGTAASMVRETRTATGGVTLGGTGDVAGGAASRTASAGVTLGGSATAFVSYSRTASSGVTLGGSASQVTQITRTAAAGVGLGGSSTSAVSFTRTAEEQLTLGGSAVGIVRLTTTASAGLTLGGSVQQVLGIVRTATGSLVLGGYSQIGDPPVVPEYRTLTYAGPDRTLEPTYHTLELETATRTLSPPAERKLTPGAGRTLKEGRP